MLSYAKLFQIEIPSSAELEVEVEMTGETTREGGDSD